jgi:hypothetical protein
VTRFCLGLPEAGRRALSDDERRRVAELRRLISVSVTDRGLLASGAAVLGSAIAVAANAAGWHAAAAAVAIAATFGFGAALLGLRDSWRDGRRVAADLREGAVDRFARGTRSLEVLVHARRVVARDGVPADLRERVVVGAAAPPPPEAPTYAVAVEAAGEAMALGLVRRALSRDERDEIRGHATRLGRIPLSLFAATAMAGVAVGVWLAGEGKGAAGGSGLLWAAVLALAWWRAVGARRLAARLRADESEGWVLRATAGSVAGMEILPSSRASWTAHGSPAPWRLAPRTR